MSTHLVREHAFGLQASPPVAAAFFTPEGERAWVPGWRPVHHHPADGALVEGGVFTTDAEGERVVWTVARLDLDRLRVRYVRVTEGHRVGLVDVGVDAVRGGSRVGVRYEMTALSEAGEGTLAAITPAAFEAEIASWKRAVDPLLERGVEARALAALALANAALSLVAFVEETRGLPEGLPWIDRIAPALEATLEQAWARDLQVGDLEAWTDALLLHDWQPLVDEVSDERLGAFLTATLAGSLEAARAAARQPIATGLEAALLDAAPGSSPEQAVEAMRRWERRLRAVTPILVGRAE